MENQKYPIVYHGNGQTTNGILYKDIKKYSEKLPKQPKLIEQLKIFTFSNYPLGSTDLEINLKHTILKRLYKMKTKNILKLLLDQLHLLKI